MLTPLGDFKEEVALNRISKGRGEGRACVESHGWLLEAGRGGGVGGMAGGGAAGEGRAFDEIGENRGWTAFVVPESTFSIVHVLSHVILPRSINI